MSHENNAISLQTHKDVRRQRDASLCHQCLAKRTEAQTILLYVKKEDELSMECATHNHKEKHARLFFGCACNLAKVYLILGTTTI